MSQVENLPHDLRPIAECVAGRGEDLAVDARLVDEVRLDAESRASHPIDHLDRIGIRASHVVNAMHGDDSRGGTERLHRRKMIRVADEMQLLTIKRQKVRTLWIAAVPSIQIASARQFERNVIGQFLHAAQVDDARERPRCELVAHQRHVPSAGTARREDSSGCDFHSPALQSVIEPPHRTQRIERLQIAEVIRLRSLDRVLRAALQIVHAQRNDVELLRQNRRTRRTDAIGPAPIVQRQHQPSLLVDVRQLAARKMDEHTNGSRPRPQRPLLRRNFDG